MMNYKEFELIDIDKLSLTKLSREAIHKLRETIHMMNSKEFELIDIDKLSLTKLSREAIHKLRETIPIMNYNHKLIKRPSSL